MHFSLHLLAVCDSIQIVLRGNHRKADREFSEITLLKICAKNMKIWSSRLTWTRLEFTNFRIGIYITKPKRNLNRPDTQTDGSRLGCQDLLTWPKISHFWWTYIFQSSSISWTSRWDSTEEVFKSCTGYKMFADFCLHPVASAKSVWEVWADWRTEHEVPSKI